MASFLRLCSDYTLREENLSHTVHTNRFPGAGLYYFYPPTSLFHSVFTPEAARSPHQPVRAHYAQFAIRMFVVGHAGLEDLKGLVSPKGRGEVEV